MRKRLIVLLWLAIIVSIIKPPNIVFAEERRIIECECDAVTLERLAALLNFELDGFATSKNNLLILDGNVLNKSGTKEQVDVTINRLLICVSDYTGNLSDADRNRISNAILEMSGSLDSVNRLLAKDVSEDLKEAVSRYTFLQKYINPVLGFVVFCVFILFAVSLLLDLSYMIVGIIRAFIDSFSQGKKPRIITKEAYRAVLDTDDSDNKKDVIAEYFKRKLISIVVLSLCIAYFLRGRIFGFVITIQDLLGEVM